MSKRKPRPCNNSWVLEMLASPTQPMPQADRTRHLTQMWQALAEMESAPAPGQKAWNLCADAVNVLESVVLHGYADDTSGLLASVVQAMANTARAHQANPHQPLRLSDAGTQDLRAVLHSYTDCINALPHRTVLRMRNATASRINSILRGQKLAHDVLIIET